MHSIRFALVLTALLGLSAGYAGADHHELPRTTAPEDASVYIISPENGATVSSPVTVVFGLKGMGVAPAGVANPNTGHHHLIIDAPTPNLDAPIPTDEHHKHFGGGQTEVTVELSPGKHTLQLVVGDMNHVPHSNAVVSKQITVTVK